MKLDTYTLGDAAITCRLCGKTSYNQNDIDNLYCGHCKRFHVKDAELVDFPITMSLLKSIQQLPPEKDVTAYLAFINQAIDHYKEQAALSLAAGNTPAETVLGFYELMDSHAPNVTGHFKDQISCRKGCAHCCHLRVSVSVPEAELIKEYCKEKDIPISRSYLKKQRHYTDETHHLAENSACVFLGPDNACKIYPVRPFSCRKYFVVSRPHLCNAKQYPRGEVAVIADNNAECMASAFLEDLSLPQALLKTDI